MSVTMFTAKAPVNIAVVKYWGKRNEDLILPINDSISVTLSKNEMSAITTAAFSKMFETDRIWLNGKEQDISNPRIQSCIQEIKEQASRKKENKSLLQWCLHINSKNNFPTAAGLASSAAGYACLVYALGALYGIEGELSGIARKGSGSACRSIYGGYVHWKMGTNDDGSDSLARQIAPKEHWPQLRILVLVVNDQQKETSSTHGMKQSVQTSDLLIHRATTIVPQRVRDITEAILEKDFHRFAELTMKESNQFHAVCLDTYPPIKYINATSFAIIELVHAYNAFYGQNKVAYTFDAGPNACLYLLEHEVAEVVALIKSYFPSTSETKSYIRGLAVDDCHISQDLLQKVKLCPRPDALQYVIHTQVGSGPKLINDPSQHLLDENGMPR